MLDARTSKLRRDIRALTTLVAAALTVACQGPAPVVVAGAAPVATVVPAGGTPAASPLAMVKGRALVGGQPLADAELVVFDALANRIVSAGGSNIVSAGGSNIVSAGGSNLKTDAAGFFEVPLAMVPGQAAMVYASNGKRAAAAIVLGSGQAARQTGLMGVDADHPLVLDLDTTATAAVMGKGLGALGRSTAALSGRDPAALRQVQDKALVAMAGAAAPTAGKLLGLASGDGVAQKIAAKMVQADPRLGAKARRLQQLDGDDLLDAFTETLVEEGLASEEDMADLVEEANNAVNAAAQETFAGDPELSAGFTAAAETPPEEPAPTEPGPGPVPAGPGTTPASEPEAEADEGEEPTVVTVSLRLRRSAAPMLRLLALPAGWGRAVIALHSRTAHDGFDAAFHSRTVELGGFVESAGTYHAELDLPPLRPAGDYDATAFLQDTSGTLPALTGSAAIADLVLRAGGNQLVFDVVPNAQAGLASLQAVGGDGTPDTFAAGATIDVHTGFSQDQPGVDRVVATLTGGGLADPLELADIDDPSAFDRFVWDSLDADLEPGSGRLTLEARDVHDRVVGTAAFDVTITGGG